jgi:hypothetical protein
MYFFNKPLVDYALDYFSNSDFTDPGRGDRFWHLFGAGNTEPISDRPFERFSDYEEMLRLLRGIDRVKYEQMHKGTAFYIMSWLAFDLRNFEKALFYMDAGVSEDVRKTKNTNNPDSWKTQPGTEFLRLQRGQGSAARPVGEVESILVEELTRFNGISGRPSVDMNDVVRFVGLFLNVSERTIISALYIFAMESRERIEELHFRQGSTGGSTQPFTVHLLTGGLLFESLLKHFYPQSEPADKKWTLNHVLTHADFRNDLGIGAIQGLTAFTLQEIYDAIQGSNTAETAFQTTAKLRNTTGHNLVRDDVFATPDIYKALFAQVINAVLFIVDAKGR